MWEHLLFSLLGEVITSDLYHSLLSAFQSSTISPLHRPPAALLVTSQLEHRVAKAITADIGTLSWRLLSHRPQHLLCGQLLFLTCSSPAWSQELEEVDSQLLLARPCQLPKWCSFSCPQAGLTGGPPGEECRVRGQLELRRQRPGSISAPLLGLEQVLCAVYMKWVCLPVLFTTS